MLNCYLYNQVLYIITYYFEQTYSVKTFQVSWSILNRTKAITIPSCTYRPAIIVQQPLCDIKGSNWKSFNNCAPCASRSSVIVELKRAPLHGLHTGTNERVVYIRTTFTYVHSQHTAPFIQSKVYTIQLK